MRGSVVLSSIALSRLLTIGSKSKTSKTRSKETSDVITSIRTFERAVNGPYKRASKAVIASNVPTVTPPLIARCPPIPYAKAVAIAATLVSAMKKRRLSIAILIPISATRRARLLKYSRSRSGSPYKATSIAPETLNRSVIVLDISAFTPKDSRVKDCNLRPTHLVGMRKTGNKRREKIVICHERMSIVIVTKTRLTTLLTTPDKVAVKACCAPITSELILEIKAPVCVRVKKAIDCFCTWAKTRERRS